MASNPPHFIDLIPPEVMGLLFEGKKRAEKVFARLTPAEQDLLKAGGRKLADVIAEQLRKPPAAPPPPPAPPPAPDETTQQELRRATDLAKLGLRPGATPDEIKKAYRRCAREAHPDRGGSDAKMADLNAAFERLQKPTVTTSKQLKRYWKLVRRGICTACATEPARPGFRTCSGCADATGVRSCSRCGGGGHNVRTCDQTEQVKKVGTR